jgi:hypothetical protein
LYLSIHRVYFVAHKPEGRHHREEALRIMHDPVYERLRARLIKFRARPSVESLVGEEVDGLVACALEAFTTLAWTGGQPNKKDWAIHWQRGEGVAAVGALLEAIRQGLKAERLWLRPLAPMMMLWEPLCAWHREGCPEVGAGGSIRGHLRAVVLGFLSEGRERPLFDPEGAGGANTQPPGEPPAEG